MKNKGKLVDLPQAEQETLLASVRRLPVFAEMTDNTAKCLRSGELIEADTGEHARCSEPGERSFWVLIDGALRAEYVEPDGSRKTIGVHRGCESFGEVPLLTGSPTPVEGTVIEPSRLLRLAEDDFWEMMATCPGVRAGILSNMAFRLEGLQVMIMQREKMASLGSMAAGLMHELNNPGAAARRATSQLRENVIRLQELNLLTCRMGLDAEKLNCIADLQKYVLRPRTAGGVCSMEEADAEEALVQWMEEAGIDDAWKLAPPLAGIGLTADKLNCARSSFSPEALSGALRWVEALVSSMQQLETIEESISRITELVLAVKRYSYGEKVGHQTIDVQEGVKSTLMILGHKLRQKEIRVSKNFGADVPLLKSTGTGLTQVWTNLLDNAIDAAPQKGAIAIHTWTDGANIYVGITDNGPGIPAENATRIFDPFFTSKAIGVGTGLGLNIANKIVTKHFNGEIRFTSEPGHTEFVVRLPQSGTELQVKVQ